MGRSDRQPTSRRPRAGGKPAWPHEGKALLRSGKTRLDDVLADMPARPEHVSNEHVRGEARAARIDAPSAVDRDCVGFDARPLVARLTAVPEGRIAAAEIGVALPQRRMR